MKTCPCPCGCEASANSLEELEKIFGYRGMLIQSYCKKCRAPHEGIQYAETINPIYNMILKNIKKDNVENIHIPKFDDVGKFITGSEKSRLIKERIVDRFKKSVFEFLTLLEEPEPQIDEKQFIDLFEMYNFKIILPEQISFFNFIINSNPDIYIILKIYQKITSQNIKILDAQLGKSYAIILTLTNDNPLDFSYNNQKICILDRKLIRCLLLYRVNELKMEHVQKLYSVDGKL